jgi:hypothetical protein
MNLDEIKEAVTQLSSRELADLESFVKVQYASKWGDEAEADFSPGGKDEGLSAENNSAIDSDETSPRG